VQDSKVAEIRLAIKNKKNRESIERLNKERSAAGDLKQKRKVPVNSAR
jgi:hypothetical protein